MADRDLKNLCVGPGGWDCPCCFEAPGKRPRQKVIRAARRRAKKRDVQEGLADTEGE